MQGRAHGELQRISCVAESRAVKWTIVTLRREMIACPYCAQSIAENAIICHYCRSNVALVISLQQRVTELERCLATAEEMLPPSNAAIATQLNSSQRPLPPQAKLRNFVWPTLMTIIAYSIFFILIITRFIHLPKPIGISLLLSPFVSGVWLGFQ